MLEIVKNPDINFIKIRNYGFIFSAVIVLISVIAIFVKGPNLGIDFTGGALLQLRFEKPITTADLRSSLAHIGKERSMIQVLGKENREYIIRAPEKDPVAFSKAVKKTLNEDFPDNKKEFLREETVEPKIGRELLTKTIWAIIVALLLILIYVSFRFDYRFGIAAVIALFHDALFTVGMLVLFQKEFSIVVVGALLTIIGYSINDSIVISDRIREKIRKMRKQPYNVILNTGVNETLSRTLLTSTTTLMAVIALLIFGGSIIADFAFTLLVGFIIGTYSSIFIVTNIVSVWEEKFPKKKK
ncbi:protein-export membrane protein SecF [candidate division WOR-3 bacterium 4484_100]|uniref:Protein-export membrane protein SecF n=1 Tax=candidate division WOR-3 bacterium 4484_100 TaxID=1936077 RepID=A0A1V4QG32_UNCW3|nr:MAG: protein-export membrane protein SecF [candidate division WOR-3 bacterium 4484_100]